MQSRRRSLPAFGSTLIFKDTYQLAGLVIVPLASVSDAGNWLAANSAGSTIRGFLPPRIPLAILSSTLGDRPGREQGNRTIIRLWNLVLTRRIGSARSESFEMTTAASKSLSNASTKRYDARFTSDPFSSLRTTVTKVGLAGGAGIGC